MVDYIKMTQQASDMLNHQDMQVSGALSQERAKKDGPVNAAAGGNGLDGKRGIGCLAKGCLVVVVLSVAFMALCVAIAFKEYMKADAQKSDSKPAETAEVVESDDDEDDEDDEAEELADELGQIFRSIVEVNGYVLSEDVDEWIDAYLYMKLPEFDERASKARWMRVVFETTLERHNARLAGIESPTREQQVTITLKDVGIELKDAEASDED